MDARCRCRYMGGYWVKATHNVTDAQRAEAPEYRRIVDESSHAVDRAVEKDVERRKYKDWLSRIAETSAASVLHMLPAPAQHGRLRRHVPDLRGRDGSRAEVKWSGIDVLFARRGKTDEPDMPYILVTGDENVMTLHGWAFYSELAVDDNWNNDWGNHGIRLPNLPHRLPLHDPA